MSRTKQAKPLLNPGDRPALSALLTNQYPRIFRIAAALTADPATAQTICHRVLSQGLKQSARWSTFEDAERWFAHHTVITSREVLSYREHMPVHPWIGAAPPEFAALLSVLWALPLQQREAFLLHHIEGFDLRRLATAMDCSSEAASNHLVAAVQALRVVAGDQLSTFAIALPQLLASVTPAPQTISLRVERQVDRFLFPRRLLRLVTWIFLLGVLAAAIWFGIKIWPMLLF